MQYVKELPNGNRVQVNKDVYLVDKYDKSFVQVIATSTVLVYRMTKQAYKMLHVPKYAGQQRSGLVWNGG